MRPIRILIADDHPLFREGIIAALNKAEEIEVTGEARNGEEAVIQATNLRPDVVLMDLDMPTMDGVTAIQTLTATLPALKVLVLSAYDDNQHIYEAMKAGASGYVLKQVNRAGLIQIIQSVHRGEVRFSPFIATLTMRDLDTPASPPGTQLTEREKEVLHLVSEGYDNNSISHALSISGDTLKSHLKHIFQKLQVKNRTQAAVTAIKHDILSSKKN